jgi:myo-inositol-1(or 4)-monophosphatase
LRETFPDHEILGEEHDYERTGSVYRWIIDPIDGTTNYAKGLPHFALSVALAKDDQVELGLVYNPVSGEMFHAIRGHGAFLNLERIRVSTVDKLQKALVATGFYYDRDEKVTRTLRQIRRLFDIDIMGIRRYGSAALDLCFVACGRFDAYWEHTLNAWDFAAGWLIAEEAGAVVRSVEDSPVRLESMGLMAANPALFSEFRDILGSIKKDGELL